MILFTDQDHGVIQSSRHYDVFFDCLTLRKSSIQGSRKESIKDVLFIFLTFLICLIYKTSHLFLRKMQENGIKACFKYRKLPEFKKFLAYNLIVWAGPSSCTMYYGVLSCKQTSWLIMVFNKNLSPDFKCILKLTGSLDRTVSNPHKSTPSYTHCNSFILR